MSFCFGLPRLFVLVARLASVGATAKRLVGDGVLWILLVLAHALLFGFGAIGLALRVLLLRSTGQERSMRVATIAPALVLVLAWRDQSRSAVAAHFSSFDGLHALWVGPPIELLHVRYLVLVPFLLLPTLQWPSSLVWRSALAMVAGWIVLRVE